MKRVGLEAPQCAQQDNCGLEIVTKSKRGVTTKAIAGCAICAFSFEMRRGNSSVKSPKRSYSADFVTTSASGIIPEGLSMADVSSAVQDTFDGKNNYSRQPHRPPVLPSAGLFLPDMTPVIE